MTNVQLGKQSRPLGGGGKPRESKTFGARKSRVTIAGGSGLVRTSRATKTAYQLLIPILGANSIVEIGGMG